MALTQYNKTISTDFLNGVVNSSSLAKQIAVSAIVTALDHIDTSGDTCEIWFKDALSAGDQTTLTAVAAAHDGVAVNRPQSVVIEPTGDLEKALVCTGRRFQPAINATHNDDATFGTLRELQGANFECVGHEDGDYLELTVHNGAMTEVGKFGETIYIPASGKLEVTSEGTSTIPQGYTLRCAYTAVNSGVARTCWLRYRMWK